MCYPASRSFADIATSMTATVKFLRAGAIMLCNTTDIKREYGVDGRYNAISAGCTAQSDGTLALIRFENAEGVAVVQSDVSDLGILVSAGDYIYMQLRLYF